MKKPYFKHYCKTCKYIDTIMYRNNYVDIYYNCDNPCNITPILIRYGDTDYEYTTIGYTGLVRCYMELHFEDWAQK